MVDTIDESDVARVDKEWTDPEALNKQEIQSQLNNDFDGKARDAFAERIAEKREPVREEARSLLVDKSTATRSGRQLRDDKGQFVGKAQNVDLDVSGGGTVTARNTNTGRETTIGSVDLNQREGGYPGRGDYYS